MVQIEQIKTGVIQENCHPVYNEEALLIIDSDAEGVRLTQETTRLGKRSAAILLTYTHYDHIDAVEELRYHHQIPIYVSPLEQAWLSNPISNLSGLDRHDDIANIIVQPAKYESKLTDYETGDMKLPIAPTSGHSVSSVSFVFDDFAVVGDMLLEGSVGRADLYTGDMQQLLHSIAIYLFTLPEELPVYPSYSDTITIQHEEVTNPFFN